MKWINKIPLWIVFLVVPVLFIGPTISSYHVAIGNEFSDIQITHSPNLMFIQKSILEYHQIPLWNPLILSGYPFDADPLSGLWYPPGWLALVFPQPFGLNLLVVLHIFLGGFGLYAYLHQIGLAKNLSLFGGLVFTLLPKIYAHFGAGHVTYIFALCLSPWLLYFAARKESRSWILQSLILAGMILADVRWIPYGILLWIAAEYQNLSTSGIISTKVVFLEMIRMGKSLFFGMLLSAPFLFPFIQYVSLSTRSQLTAADNLELSLPVGKLLTLVFPSIGGTAEWMIFTGSSIFLFGLISLVASNRKKTMPWLIVFVFSLIFALGDQVPGMKWLVSLPALNSLRIPPRVLFPGSIAIIILAVYGFSALMESNNRKKNSSILLLSFFVFLITGIIVGFQRQGSQSEYQLWLITPLILFCIFIMIGLLQKLVIKPRSFVIGVCLIVFLEIGLIAQITFTSKATENQVSASILNLIQEYPSERVYSPSYSIGQDEAINHGIGLTEGVHPLQLIEYVNFFSGASGVPNDQYSVVQPPLLNGNPTEDNKDAVPNLDLLSRLNVRYIVASFPMQKTNWLQIASGPKIWIYQNQRFHPYPMILGGAGQPGKVTLVNYTPNKIEYLVSGPGTMKTSDVMYPGWTASLDGRFVQIQTDETIFRSVKIPSGNHSLVMVYHPWLTYLGIAISLITLLILLVGLKERP